MGPLSGVHRLMPQDSCGVKRRSGTAHRATCQVPHKADGMAASQRMRKGAKGSPHQPALTASIRVCCTSDSRHASGGRAELRSVPILLQKSQVDLGCADAQRTPKMAFLAVASAGTRFLEGN